jgi:hypothetical protein
MLLAYLFNLVSLKSTMITFIYKNQTFRLFVLIRLYWPLGRMSALVSLDKCYRCVLVPFGVHFINESYTYTKRKGALTRFANDVTLVRYALKGQL